MANDRPSILKFMDVNDSIPLLSNIYLQLLFYSTSVNAICLNTLLENVFNLMEPKIMNIINFSIKKLNRILNIKSIKITVLLVTVYLILFTLIIYHLYRVSSKRYHKSDEETPQQPPSSDEEYLGTPMRHIPYNEIQKEMLIQDEDFSIEMEETKQGHMINTPGCIIPLAVVDYRKNITKRKRGGCGLRIIHIKRYEKDYVQATLNEVRIKKQFKMGNKYDCYYRFFHRSNLPSHEYSQVWYTPSQKLRNGEKIKLESDFLNVQCFQYDKSNRTHLIYEDDYAFCKKKNRINNKNDKSAEKYNVLIIGIDSMSLPRFAQTMPRTTLFFKNNHWSGFQGYHKVGDNTLLNLLPLLTGKHSSEIIKKCYRRMDQCNDYFLWNTFKKSGYVTAFGEDYIHLPDTFSKDFIFRHPPTDHYMRPFFMNREREINGRSIVCSGKSTAGGQLLDFALDFALTYRNDSFFGFFWINSFSHNINNRPQDGDVLFENFFNRLIYTGVLDNTFIIFMSDHGIRFGKYRQQVESYYDNRLPCLFIFTPRTFKNNYPLKLKAIILNQYRLITPYDLFETLNEINDLVVGNSYKYDRKYDMLFNRQSLFKIVSTHRTCYEVGIDEKWCSCHKLYPLDHDDPEGLRSVQSVASHINKILKTIQTKRCWYCLNLSIQNISRLHFYYDRDRINLYHVVAFSMSPRNVVYEATILRNDTSMNLIGSIDILSQYKGFGNCTIKGSAKYFCICEKVDSCRKTIQSEKVEISRRTTYKYLLKNATVKLTFN